MSDCMQVTPGIGLIGASPHKCRDSAMRMRDGGPHQVDGDDLGPYLRAAQAEVPLADSLWMQWHST